MKTLYQNWKIKKWQQRGQKYLVQGKIEKANLLFQKVILLDNSTENLYNFGLSLLGLNRYEEAEKIFQKIYEDFPENTVNSLSLAEAKMMLEKWDEASAIFSSLIKQNPKHKKLSFYSEICKDVILREKFRKSKELINLAMQALNRKKDEKALHFLLEALDYNPQNAHLLNNIGSIYRLQKKYKDALKFFEKAIAIEPENMKIKKNISLVRRKLK